MLKNIMPAALGACVALMVLPASALAQSKSCTDLAQLPVGTVTYLQGTVSSISKRPADAFPPGYTIVIAAPTLDCGSFNIVVSDIASCHVGSTLVARGNFIFRTGSDEPKPYIGHLLPEGGLPFLVLEHTFICR